LPGVGRDCSYFKKSSLNESPGNLNSIVPCMLTVVLALNCHLFFPHICFKYISTELLRSCLVG
jgi:hypothetical protein